MINFVTAISARAQFLASMFALSLMFMATTAMAQQRIALVIGNSNYGFVTSLDNPERDARLIAASLEETDFDVTLLIDANQAEMNRALSAFGRSLREGGSETTGLFYYAGHGVQSFGSNYLLPVDVSLTDAADLDLESVEAQSVLRQMASARNRSNFVILDACRNNPFSDIPDFDDPGLAEMKAPTGTFLSYATAPGDVAVDGIGENSPFTLALAKEILTPGAPAEQVFKQVRVSVLEQTNGMQTPWDTSSLTSNFVFASAPVESAEEIAERQLWESVQATRDPVQIMLFLRGYPDSKHAEDARALLSEVIELELETPTPAAPEPVAEGPSAEEQALFEAAQANPTVGAYEKYLEAFPHGTFAEFASQEIEALSTKTGTDPVAEGIPEDVVEDVEVSSLTRSAEPPQELRYDLPLVAPGSVIDGVPLSEITTLSPEFPPVEGLPEEFWAEVTCASCHQWNQERLCAQSNVYLTLSGQKSLEKLHPFSGVLKRNLRAWAAGGCQ